MCVDAQATRLLSINSYVGTIRPHTHVFLTEIIRGEPTHPGTEELLDVGWFDPAQLPQPVYSTVVDAILDTQRGDYGVLREIPVTE